MCILGIMSQIHSFHLQMWIFYIEPKRLFFVSSRGRLLWFGNSSQLLCSVTSVDLMSLCSVVVFTSLCRKRKVAGLILGGDTDPLWDWMSNGGTCGTPWW